MYDLRWTHAALHGARRCRRVGAGVLSIHLPVGVLRRFELLTLAMRLAYAPSVLVSPIAIIIVLDAVHAVWTTVRSKVVVAAETRATACTAAWSFVMSCQCVATCKATTALFACMRPLTSVKLGVAFEVVQTAETCLAGLTNVWLLLAVGEKVTFEVVMAREVSGAVWTLVSFVGCW